jgi:hypothetical protein
MSVLATVKKDIASLPEKLWETYEVALILSLAHGMDNQIGGAAASKEIDRLLTKLKDNAPANTGDALDDLARARAARRGA